MLVSYISDYDLAVQAVMNAIKGLPELKGIKKVVVYDSRYGSDDASLVVRSCIADFLKKKEIEVYYSTGPGVQEVGMEIGYTVHDLKVVYTREFRRFFIGEKMVERWAHVQIEISLIKEGRLFGLYRLTGDAKSVIPKKEVPVLRSASFTQDYSTQQTGGSLIEPLIVTTIVGILIYVFYVPK